MIKKSHELTLGKTIASLIFFTLLWAVVTDAWDTSTVIFGSNKTEWQQLIYDISSRAVWTFPVLFFLSRYKTDIYVNFTDMFKRRIHVKLLAVLLAIFTVYATGSMLLNYGGFRVNPSFSPLRNISFYLAVGIAEELVYRAWGLNAFLAVTTRGKAFLLTGAFFILLHWPAYFIALFRTGVFAWDRLLLQSLVVLVTGLLFGYVFIKNKSIWIAIILHMYFDLVVDLLAG